MARNVTFQMQGPLKWCIPATVNTLKRTEGVPLYPYQRGFPSEASELQPVRYICLNHLFKNLHTYNKQVTRSLFSDRPAETMHTSSCRLFSKKYVVAPGRRRVMAGTFLHDVILQKYHRPDFLILFEETHDRKYLFFVMWIQRAISRGLKTARKKHTFISDFSHQMSCTFFN